jgi:chloramphenicol 3-O phosphotransferase
MKTKIIILNGTSSAGKSTLAKALRPTLEPQFCYYASDQLADAGFRPLQPEAREAGRAKFSGDSTSRSTPLPLREMIFS